MVTTLLTSNIQYIILTTSTIAINVYLLIKILTNIVRLLPNNSFKKKTNKDDNKFRRWSTITSLIIFLLETANLITYSYGTFSNRVAESSGYLNDPGYVQDWTGAEAYTGRWYLTILTRILSTWALNGILVRFHFPFCQDLNVND